VSIVISPLFWLTRRNAKPVLNRVDGPLLKSDKGDSFTAKARLLCRFLALFLPQTLCASAELRDLCVKKWFAQRRRDAEFEVSLKDTTTLNYTDAAGNYYLGGISPLAFEAKVA
jgi:hypothetical protein